MFLFMRRAEHGVLHTMSPGDVGDIEEKRKEKLVVKEENEPAELSLT